MYSTNTVNIKTVDDEVALIHTSAVWNGFIWTVHGLCKQHVVTFSLLFHAYYLD